MSPLDMLAVGLTGGFIGGSILTFTFCYLTLTASRRKARKQWWEKIVNEERETWKGQ